MNNYEYINDELRKNNIIPLSDIIQILKGKVSDPHVGSKKTLKILDIFKRQIEFIHSTTKSSNWYDEFKALDNEMRALALSEDEEE